MKYPRLSFGAVSILHAVADGSRFGFDIMSATGLTSGTVYPTLDRLEQRRPPQVPMGGRKRLRIAKGVRRGATSI